MKWYNSIKFQFVVFFTLFIGVSVGTSAIMGGKKMSQATISAYSDMGISIAEGAASIVDGDKFEVLANSMDKEDPYYEETRLQLFQIKEVSPCLYLFTMSPAKENIAYYIIDGSAPPDDEENFSDLGDEENIEDDEPFKRVFIYNTTEVGDLEFREDWGWLFTVYAPIFNSAGKVVGVVGCDFDGEQLHESIKSENFEQLIIAAVSIIVGLILLIFFLQKIFVPIGKISNIVKEISMGEGDLTKRISNIRDDEIGNMANFFNITLDKIKNMIINIKKDAADSFNAGNNLVSTMHTTAEAVGRITKAITSAKEKTTSQSSSVAETSAAMQLVTMNIDQLTNHVDSQTESVAQSSSAIEQMLANVQSVTNTLINNEKSVRELIEVSDIGRNSLQKVSQDIQEIAKESEGLLQINTVMENIASQTNLLSMNAAIEAAHAGESGKGFAVVAGEIRKLAVSSSDQSKTISEVLKRMKNAIDTITLSTDIVLEKFHDIENRVKVVSEQETNIRNAMEEQGKGSKQILESVAIMNELTQKVKAGAKEMLASSKDVIEESRNLEKVTIEINNGMNDMANGAEQINSAVESVNRISETNKECITSLSNEVSKFKID